MIVGARILLRLKEMGFSQAELARRIGVRQSTINGLTRGEQRSSTHLHRIAAELKTTPAYLAGETDNPALDAPAEPSLSSQDRALLDQFHKLEFTSQKAILEIMRVMTQAMEKHPGGVREIDALEPQLSPGGGPDYVAVLDPKVGTGLIVAEAKMKTGSSSKRKPRSQGVTQ